MRYVDTPDRLELIQTSAPDHVTAFLRAILAEHGRTLDFIQRASMVGMRDWTRVEKRAYFDILTGGQVFTITLQTLEGSVRRLECSLDSVMNLTSHMRELVNAPQSFRAYSPATLKLFNDQLQQAIALLDEADEETSAEQVVADSSRPADPK